MCRKSLHLLIPCQIKITRCLFRVWGLNNDFFEEKNLLVVFFYIEITRTTLNCFIEIGYRFPNVVRLVKEIDCFKI